MAFLLLSLLAVIAVHVPVLPLPVQAFGHGFANLVGQEHRWNMFSADPRGTSLDLWAELDFADGRTRIWRIDRSRIVGDLAFYHWVKWMETAVLEPQKAELAGLAEWLADTSTAPVDGVVVYSRQRIGLLPNQPPPPADVSVLGRFTTGGTR